MVQYVKGAWGSCVMMIRFTLGFFLILLGFSAFAMAEGASGSYREGLLHTLLGLDHLIAMIAVGLISSQIGGRAVWQVPFVFVMALVLGGVTGLIWPAGDAREWILSTSEPVIMLSDLALALAIIWAPLAHRSYEQAKVPLSISLLIIIFGLFHGFAHGGEIPDGAVPTFYVLGFATTSALMHILGVGIGEIARAFQQPRVARGICAAVLLGISIPYQVDFWNTIMPGVVLEIFKF